MQECANQGRRNAGPLSDRVRQERIPLDPALYERCNAPVIWPAHLDEDTGRVNEHWAEEMMRLRVRFWRPLGANMILRTITYSN